MISTRLITTLIMMVGLLSACLGPVKSLYPPELGGQNRRVHMISHGWHTGIALRTNDISRAIWPQSEDFANVEYIEVGWGDWDYYQTPAATLSLALKAALVPTRSVVHLIGFNSTPEEYFSGSTIIEIVLSEKGFVRLSEFIAGEYSGAALINQNAPQQGLYSTSQFYPARGTFHLFNNCNKWVARALRSAGCPITPLYAITAGNIVYQTKTFGFAVGSRNQRR